MSAFALDPRLPVPRPPGVLVVTVVLVVEPPRFVALLRCWSRRLASYYREPHADQALYITEISPLRRVTKRYRRAVGAGARCPPNPVHIAFGVVG